LFSDIWEGMAHFVRLWSDPLVGKIRFDRRLTIVNDLGEESTSVEHGKGGDVAAVENITPPTRGAARTQCAAPYARGVAGAAGNRSSYADQTRL
jgi:hypothetical protein